MREFASLGAFEEYSRIRTPGTQLFAREAPLGLSDASLD